MLFQGAPETIAGTEGVDFSYDIPLYSMLFQGAPETLAGTEGVDFYIAFHDIPCYSKALQRPLRAPRELILGTLNAWHSGTLSRRPFGRLLE